MIHTGLNLDVNPELIAKLSAGQMICHASHDDGSANRINTDAVLEAGSYATSFGILAALFMWIRKRFRNRGKTKEDFAAEREAAQINRTCAALKQMLLEYLQAAQQGSIDPEALDELIDTLGEMEAYHRAGKLLTAGKEDLSKIRDSVAAFTASVTGDGPVRSAGNAFAAVREQLIRQREWIGERETSK